MNSLVKKILNDAKNAYKESVVIGNESLQDYLLNIITNAQMYLNMHNIDKNAELDSKDLISNEIDKVKRKVPKWFNNKTQYNSIILDTYMKLSDNNKYPINVSNLEKHTNLDSNIFYRNYNQMKIIAERNHAKVFQEENGFVELWEPVSNYIVNIYK